MNKPKQQVYLSNPSALITGIVLIASFFFFQLVIQNGGISQDTFYLLTIPVRIFALIWCVIIARKEGLSKGWWGFISFFLPAISLIIISIGRREVPVLAMSVDNPYGFEEDLPEPVPQVKAAPTPKPRKQIRINKAIFTSKIAYLIYVVIAILVIMVVKYELDIMKEERRLELRNEYAPHPNVDY